MMNEMTDVKENATTLPLLCSRKSTNGYQGRENCPSDKRNAETVWVAWRLRQFCFKSFTVTSKNLERGYCRKLDNEIKRLRIQRLCRLKCGTDAPAYKWRRMVIVVVLSKIWTLLPTLDRQSLQEHNPLFRLHGAYKIRRLSTWRNLIANVEP